LANLFPDEKHGRFVTFTFTDDNPAGNRQITQLAPHRIDRRAVRLLFISPAPQARSGHSRRLCDPSDLEG
jgi:hypothetical protein